ncbi:hypothetical protein AURDEDRAFT_173844 [Auricularia subglabra TFB-10046 SS5]|uniref:Glycosyltransferase family 69 protein n=1 Tax=Auricularia subglabra (strain TFB-10046 / SS5) TaxID=717982 RepID=J0WVI3_AURST|nr:hypothetical protein AURDEDRAFT_173844 [Auricularia subglabra TFB-10046 SS5]
MEALARRLAGLREPFFNGLQLSISVSERGMRPKNPRVASAFFWLSHLLAVALALLALLVMYTQFWYANWWHRGGKAITFPPAFPPHRTRFIVLAAVVPRWAGYVAVSLFAYACMRFIWAAVAARRSGGGSEYAYTRLSTAEREPMLSDPGEPRNSIDDSSNLTAERLGGRFTPYFPWTPPLWWLVLFPVFASLGLWGVHLRRNWMEGDVVGLRLKPRVDLASRRPRPQGYGTGEKVFIAALFHNNKDVLPFWSKELLRVINYLGPENVFVSIVESYSKDSTRKLLTKFDQSLAALNVPRRIVLNDTSIPRPEKMSTNNARIQFLADTRNLVLEPLRESAEYEWVVFSNDVFVRAEAVIELIHTRNGDYDMACGVDYGPWGVYDAWVMRDRLGNFMSSLWPYTLEDIGAQAIMQDEPAPVSACWNGIVSMRAQPFLRPNLRARNGTHALSAAPLPHRLPETHPAYASGRRPVPPREQPPLMFRKTHEGECFSSECFLLPYDMRLLFGMEKVYMHPRVVTAYIHDHFVYGAVILRHWLVLWWMRTIDKGYGAFRAKMIVGPRDKAWMWDGGACFGPDER